MTTTAHRVIVADINALRATLKRLNAWESERIDLSYASNDSRRIKPDDEMPPEWHVEHARLQRAVCLIAARLGGESTDAANMFADEPTSTINPYNIERTRFAASIIGWKL